MNRSVARVGRAAAVLVVLGSLLALTGCLVGSGKVARAHELGPLPAGLRIVSDVSQGCREGESGFDYRFVVIDGTNDLSSSGPLLSALRANGFYHSIGLADDLPWVAVGYQKQRYPLRAEIGPLSRYLTDPNPWQGPAVDRIPADVREHPERAVLVAMRPTDFLCETPL